MESYTKKDFKVEWFSGSGAGGQHRNKHQNCCRIIHLPTGLKSQSTKHKSRIRNQEAAFRRLVSKLLALGVKEPERDFSNDVVRTYKIDDGVVIDHGSGESSRALQDVLDGGVSIDAFLEKRGLYKLPRTGRA